MKERSILEHCPECNSNNTIQLNERSNTWECMDCQCQWWIHQHTVKDGIRWKPQGEPKRRIKNPGIFGTSMQDFFYETPEKK